MATVRISQDLRNSVRDNINSKRDNTPEMPKIDTQALTAAAVGARLEV